MHVESLVDADQRESSDRLHLHEQVRIRRSEFEEGSEGAGDRRCAPVQAPAAPRTSDSSSCRVRSPSSGSTARGLPSLPRAWAACRRTSASASARVADESARRPRVPILSQGIGPRVISRKSVGPAELFDQGRDRRDAESGQRVRAALEHTIMGSPTATRRLTAPIARESPISPRIPHRTSSLTRQSRLFFSAVRIEGLTAGAADPRQGGRTRRTRATTSSRLRHERDQVIDRRCARSRPRASVAAELKQDITLKGGIFGASGRPAGRRSDPTPQRCALSSPRCSRA